MPGQFWYHDKSYSKGCDNISKINYVIRQDGPSLLSSESDWEVMNLDSVLVNYPYIIDSMVKDEYYIANDCCSFFSEIVFKNKVVGFATYEIVDASSLRLLDAFIMPEFRGNRLFFDELCKMDFIASGLAILQPDRRVIDILLDFAFAKHVSENIVATAFPLHFNEDDLLSSDEKTLFKNVKATHFYDLSLSSAVLCSGNEIFYHKLLENDAIAGYERAELDSAYFDNLCDFFNENDFSALIEELSGELPHPQFGFDEIIGRGDALSDLMQNMVESGLITYPEALDIKAQITSEYDSGVIEDSEVYERLFSMAYPMEMPFKDFNEFKTLVDAADESEDTLNLKEFVSLFEDNEELGEGILDAIFTGDEEAYRNLMVGAMLADEEFFENFINFADDEYVNPDLMARYRLEEIEYGKEYPVSYDVDIYHVLSSMAIDIDYATVMEFLRLEDAPDKDSLNQVMAISGLICQEELEVDWSMATIDFKTSELREILQMNNLSTKGTKKELLGRLEDNQVTIAGEFYITDEGINYLKDFSWIRFYERFLHDFDFNDYYRYLDGHEGDLKEVSLSYLDEHIALAQKMDDEEYLEDCFLAKEDIAQEGDEFIDNFDITRHVKPLM